MSSLDEVVPIVGPCSDCNTEYEHKNTVENPETGFIHFVYECSVAPGKKESPEIIKIMMAITESQVMN